MPPQVQGSAGDIQQILAEVDKDGNGVIDYEEFCDMMRAGHEEELHTSALRLKSRIFTDVVRGEGGDA